MSLKRLLPMLAIPALLLLTAVPASAGGKAGKITNVTASASVNGITGVVTFNSSKIPTYINVFVGDGGAPLVLYGKGPKAYTGTTQYVITARSTNNSVAAGTTTFNYTIPAAALTGVTSTQVYVQADSSSENGFISLSAAYGPLSYPPAAP